MNDNTSNTPDNASRPGKKNPRPRHPNGKFMTNAEIAELEQLNKAVTELTPEQFENLPLVGSHGDISVGEFLDAAHNFTESDPLLGSIIRETDKSFERAATRIGQHVDVENKESKGHTRRPKRVKRPESDRDISRSIRFYQVRNIPGMNGKYGLFYADGVEWNDTMRSSKDLIQHWFGVGGYEAHHANAAVHFNSAAEAKKFRRDNFKLPTGFGAQELDHEYERIAVRGANRQFRVMGASRKHPSHTTSKKRHNTKERKVRDDLVKLYALISRGSLS